MTDKEIDKLVQELYSWAQKRDIINERSPRERPLNNDLIIKAARTIEYLRNFEPDPDK